MLADTTGGIYVYTFIQENVLISGITDWHQWYPKPSTPTSVHENKQNRGSCLIVNRLAAHT